MEVLTADFSFYLAFCTCCQRLNTLLSLAEVLGRNIKTLEVATPVLDLYACCCSTNDTDDEKQKYIHHKAPIYTEMYIYGGRRVSCEVLCNLLGRQWI